MMRCFFLIPAGLALVLPLQAAQAQDTTPKIGIDKVKGRTGYTRPINATTNLVGQLSQEEKLQRSQTDFLTSTGSEYADEGDFEAAEKAYQRALKMEPDNEEILMRLGSLYVKMKRFEDATASFKKLIDLNEENALAHNNLAWCYAVGPEIRSVPLALRHSREALLFAPRMPSVWNTLAEAYYVAGDYKKALRSADQALELLQSMGNPPEGSRESFEAQRAKILRAEQALKMLDGTLDLDD